MTKAILALLSIFVLTTLFPWSALCTRPYLSNYPLPGNFTAFTYEDLHARSLMDNELDGALYVASTSGNQVLRIDSKDIEGDSVEITWGDNGEIEYINIGGIPSAPWMQRVTNPALLRLVREIADRLHPAGAAPAKKISWRPFLESQVGTLAEHYSSYDIQTLIANHMELRVRFKLLRAPVLAQLGLKAAGTTPFKVLIINSMSFSADEIVAILDQHSFNECEEALKTAPF